MSAASDRPRPWYRHPLGVAYLLVLGLVVTAALVATIIPGEKENKTLALMVAYGALDVMILPLAVWAFRRTFPALTRYPAADLLLGLLFVALIEAALVIFLGVVCLNVVGGG